MTAAMAFIYLCTNFSKLKDKQVLIKLLINIILIICITAIFWIPLLETYFYTDYVVYEEGAMATTESIENNALDLKDLFLTEKPDPTKEIIVFEIGIHVIIFLLLPIIAIKRFWKENTNKKDYILFLILGIFSLFISTKYFPWGSLGKYLELIQFPWRMMIFENFFLSIICALNVQYILKRFKYIDNLCLACICLLFITIFNYIPINNNIKNIEEIDNIGTLSVNKWQAINGMGKGEYLPVKANDSREYIIERLDEIYILEGDAEIENYSKNGQNLYAEVSGKSVTLELPYIYYPGYTVYFNGEKIDTFETENGFIGINLVSSGTIEVEYTGTILMSVSKVISIIGVISLIVYIIICKKSKFFVHEIDKT